MSVRSRLEKLERILRGLPPEVLCVGKDAGAQAWKSWPEFWASVEGRKLVLRAMLIHCEILHLETVEAIRGHLARCSWAEPPSPKALDIYANALAELRRLPTEQQRELLGGSEEVRPEDQIAPLEEVLATPTHFPLGNGKRRKSQKQAQEHE